MQAKLQQAILLSTILTSSTLASINKTATFDAYSKFDMGVSGFEDKETGKWMTKEDRLREDQGTLDINRSALFDQKTGKWVNFADYTEDMEAIVEPVEEFKIDLSVSMIFDSPADAEVQADASLDLNRSALWDQTTSQWVNYADFTEDVVEDAPVDLNRSAIFDQKSGQWVNYADFTDDMEPIVEPSAAASSSSDDLEDDWVLVSKIAKQPSKTVNIDQPAPSTTKKTLKPSTRRPARKAQKSQLVKTAKKPATTTTNIHNAGLQAYLQNDIELLTEIRGELRRPTGRIFTSTIIGAKPNKTAGIVGRLASSKKDDLMASVIVEGAAAPEMEDNLEASVVVEAEAQTWAQYFGWA